MRALCLGCGYITERCLCDVLSPVFNQTVLIVLQHQEEKKHALNTVRPMQKCFQNLLLFTGENFQNESQLISLLEKEKTALLFPGESAINLKSFASSPFPYTHLVLLDGTWKKAKKIYYTNSFLHSLPKIFLEAEEKSNYRIRQSSMEHGLSTLEAAVAALHAIEPDLDCSSLTKAFMKMIDFQIEKMGSEVFKNNYQKKGDE